MAQLLPRHHRRITTVQLHGVVSQQGPQYSIKPLTRPWQSITEPMDADETAPMANGVIGSMKRQAVVLGASLSGVLSRCMGGGVEHRHMIVLEGTDDRTCAQEVIERYNIVTLRQRQLQAQLFGRDARVLLHPLQNELCR